MWGKTDLTVIFMTTDYIRTTEVTHVIIIIHKDLYSFVVVSQRRGKGLFKMGNQQEEASDGYCTPSATSWYTDGVYYQRRWPASNLNT